MSKPLTAAEYRALSSAVAYAETTYEDEDDSRGRDVLNSAWAKVQAWQAGRS